jgi:hypothetical protein
MTDTTSQAGTVEAGPLTFSEGVSAIENLLPGDPETDLTTTDEASSTNEAEPTSEDAEDAELVIEDDDAEESSEGKPDAPPAVGDDFIVTLSDGQTISLGELKRNNLFQRDYSRKTEELKRTEEALQAQFQQQREQVEQELLRRHDLVLQLYSELVPEAPQRPSVSASEDPFAWNEYTEQKELYELRMQQLNQVFQQREVETEAQRKQREQQEEQQLEVERAKMLEAIPKLKDEKKLAEFKAEVAETLVGSYGFTTEELNGLRDHRMMRVVHDAIQYQKAKARAGQVKQEIASKPRLETKQRMAPQSTQIRDRQGRFDSHREAGTIDSAAKLIETLI